MTEIKKEKLWRDQEDEEKSVQNLHMTVLNRKESLWEKRLL